MSPIAVNPISADRAKLVVVYIRNPSCSRSHDVVIGGAPPAERIVPGINVGRKFQRIPVETSAEVRHRRVSFSLTMREAAS